MRTALLFGCRRWALLIAQWQRGSRRRGLAGVLVAWLAGGICAQAATYQVGPTRTYQTVGSLPALHPGDNVEVDPATYNEVKRWTTAGTAAQPISIRGVGAPRPVFDATGLNVDGSLPHPRAVFQVEADYITLENLEFQHATNGDNGAGIRIISGNNITVTQLPDYALRHGHHVQ